VGLAAGPLVQAHPDSLLSGEIGVARPRPETAGVETAVQLLAGVAVVFWCLGCGLVFRLRLVEVPLLLVGEELDDD
jgi:hypothetical protein